MVKENQLNFTIEIIKLASLIERMYQPTVLSYSFYEFMDYFVILRSTVENGTISSS